MTIITAAYRDGQYAMACDTLHYDGYVDVTSSFNEKPSKIVKYKDYFLGVAGYSSLAEILEDIVAKDDFSGHDFNSKNGVFKFMQFFHNKLKETYNYNSNYKHNDGPVESNGISLLVVGPGGIFSTDGMCSVIQHKKFWAIGSGHRVALGAMYTSNGIEGYDSKGIVDSGVRAACAFDDGCAWPMIIETGEYKE